MLSQQGRDCIIHVDWYIDGSNHRTLWCVWLLFLASVSLSECDRTKFKSWRRHTRDLNSTRLISHQTTSRELEYNDIVDSKEVD